MGSCALIGGLLTLLLPETLGTILPENMDDVENSTLDGKPFFACWSKAKVQRHLEAIIAQNIDELERLKDIGSYIYRTDTDSDIRMIIDSYGYKIKSNPLRINLMKQIKYLDI